MHINVSMSDEAEDSWFPRQAFPTEDAGYDLCSLREVTLRPGEVTRVPTGLAFELPKLPWRMRFLAWLCGADIELLMRVETRTGIALTLGVIVAASNVDRGYRPKLGDPDATKILLTTIGLEPVTIPAGTRVAQVIFYLVLRPKLCRVKEKQIKRNTQRDFGELGHTGLRPLP